MVHAKASSAVGTRRLAAPRSRAAGDPAQATAGRKPKGLGDFTLLMIDGAIEELPPMLGKLLADDARIVTGLVERGVSRIAVGRASGGKVALMRLAEMGIPRLAEFDREEAWSF